MNLEPFVGVASLVAAGLSVVIVVYTLVSRAILQRKQASVLRTLQVEAVLEASDLKDLGDLFVRDLGGTSMPVYVRDEQQRREFRRAFNAVRAFVGDAPEEAQAAGESRAGDPTAHGDLEREGLWSQELLTPDGERAIRDIQNGESWNALARMRRALEVSLADRVGDFDDGKRRLAAGQLIAVASKRGAIPSEWAQALRYPLSIANRAVHGEEVPPDVAVEAVVLIDRFLRELHQQASPGHS